MHFWEAAGVFPASASPPSRTQRTLPQAAPKSGSKNGSDDQQEAVGVTRVTR